MVATLRRSDVLTRFGRTEGCRAQASVGQAGLPGGTAASAPDAADPRPSFHAALLCQEGPAAGGSVHEHVVEQHPREAAEHIHGPGLEGRGARMHVSKEKRGKGEKQKEARSSLLHDNMEMAAFRLQTGN